MNERDKVAGMLGQLRDHGLSAAEIGGTAKSAAPTRGG